MPTKNEKSAIRLQKSFARQFKKTIYTGLNETEIKYIKTLKRQQANENELNRFYREAKRLSNGVIDWDCVDECTTNWFTEAFKLNERLNKQLSKFEDLIDTKATFKYFTQINTHSQSY